MVPIDADGIVLARLARPTTERPVRLAVLSDLHVATRARGTDRLFHRTEDRAAAAIESINAADPDLVCFDGDLTKDGEPWNFDRFDELVAELEAPFVATPGNHDVSKTSDEHDTPPVSSFEDRYAPESLPLVRSVGGIDLVVCNSATVPDGSLEGEHRGALSRAQLEWLETTLQVVSNPVVAFHHNLLPILGSDLVENSPWQTFSLQNGETVFEVLDRYDVPLVISGHHHVPATVSAGSLTQLIAPATCAYPLAHLLIDIDAQGTTVTLVPHATAADRRESHDAMCAGPPLRHTFVRLIDETLTAAPLVDATADRTESLPTVRRRQFQS
ncbi:metallophosphoesterase family protein [Natronorubrum halophilum]|uniref:metallophosphoesterase family protein n=1 Tax=Natronorubrum halophilum TaxID=1702106 RepID=UPI000EF64728|nr:metallophosphoesterase [Natronorubrum halophilum]